MARSPLAITYPLRTTNPAASRTPATALALYHPMILGKGLRIPPLLALFPDGQFCRRSGPPAALVRPPRLGAPPVGSSAASAESSSRAARVSPTPGPPRPGAGRVPVQPPPGPSLPIPGSATSNSVRPRASRSSTHPCRVIRCRGSNQRPGPGCQSGQIRRRLAPPAIAADLTITRRCLICTDLGTRCVPARSMRIRREDAVQPARRPAVNEETTRALGERTGDPPELDRRLRAARRSPSS